MSYTLYEVSNNVYNFIFDKHVYKFIDRGDNKI